MNLTLKAILQPLDESAAVRAARARVAEWHRELKRQLGQARPQVERKPTPAQREAGNYRKGHVRLHGLDVTIENPRGSVRTAVDGSWSRRMPYDYGYLKRTTGADQDGVDVFIGDHPASQLVFVVDQVDRDGAFDEHKVILGALTEAEARQIYASAYPAGWRIGPVTSLTMDQFKAWLRDGDQAKPLAPRVRLVIKARPATDPRQMSLFGGTPGSIRNNPTNRLGVDRIGRLHWRSSEPPKAPEADGATEVAKVPAAVLRQVEGAVATLGAIRKQQEIARGLGYRYEYEAWRNQRWGDSVAAAVQTLDLFRHHAPDNNVDADRVLAHLAGGALPVVPELSAQAREYFEGSGETVVVDKPPPGGWRPEDKVPRPNAASTLPGPAERPRPKLVLRPDATEAKLPIDERPTEAKKYGGETKPAPWEVLETDFIDQYQRERIAGAERNLRYWREKFETAPEPKRPSRSAWKLSARDEAQGNATHWEKRLAELRATGLTDRDRDHARNQYIATVKEAISKGKPVPQQVIDQRPEYTKALTARRRYEKGRHTSFANESVAVNRTMKAERGFKAKRQDGRPIPQAQIDELVTGVQEVESVIGPLRDLLEFSDLTIAHTNGKAPFLKHAGGLFVPSQRSISVGTDGVKALAHELAHWLDFEAGRLSGHDGGYSKGREFLSSGWRSPDRDLISAATSRINNTREVKKYFSTKFTKVLEGEKKEMVSRERVHLGSYWREPWEVLARLAEQYISTELGGKVTQAADTDYTGKPGWWTAADFEPLRPLIKAALERRLKIMRDAVAAGKPVAKAVIRLRRTTPAATAEGCGCGCGGCA